MAGPSGTTPILQLPYPTPDDSVDVPRDIQALAVKLDGYSSLRPPAVTSLPGAPVDGQEVYYLADVTNGVIWHLRYNAAAAKWQYLGGSPLQVTQTGSSGQSTANNTTWTDLTGMPTLTIPLAGSYWLTIYGAIQQAAASALAEARVTAFNQAETMSTAAAIATTTAQYVTASPFARSILTVTAGTVLKLKIATSNVNYVFGNAAPWMAAWRLEAEPTQIG